MSYIPVKEIDSVTIRFQNKYNIVLSTPILTRYFIMQLIVIKIYKEMALLLVIRD